jgi:DNA-binding transcriptional regulator YdaS (Cro superfamily)
MAGEIRIHINLSDVLRQFGVSDREFADGVGVAMQTFRAYRRGTRTIPPHVVLAAERNLKIPRHSLRPDLWAPPDTKRRRNCAA